MHRPLALATTLVFVAAITSAAPVPKEFKRKAAPNVVGTTWVGTNSVADLSTMQYTFQEGGGLTYSRGQQVYTKGTWAQDGDTLTWEVNDRYAEYTLTFKDGGFEGTAKNVKGVAWTIALRPKDK